MLLERQKITDYFQNLQKNICKSLEEVDGKSSFFSEKWEREEGGGGITNVFQDGNIWEKGCVNFSAVSGKMPEVLAKRDAFGEGNFFATGVSIVLHTHNPFVPIIHMNVRYFEMNQEKAWFGGGIDLTPHYIQEDDAKFFHQQLKNACDKFSPDYYNEFKKWADNYFYIKHRNETRGIGGIFFDRLNQNEHFSWQDRFDFVQTIGNSFIPTYLPIVQKNKNKDYTQKHKDWQLYRRGRYVEFNLVYDAGTKFGLETSGRIESILLSLPKQAQWIYDLKPEKNTPEFHTLSLLKKEIDWV